MAWHCTQVQHLHVQTLCLPPLTWPGRRPPPLAAPPLPPLLAAWPLLAAAPVGAAAAPAAAARPQGCRRPSCCTAGRLSGATGLLLQGRASLQ